MSKIDKFFSIRANADSETPAEISVRGLVGSYYDAETYSPTDTEEDVLNALKKIPSGKKINLRINSLGGNFGLALGCYNALARRSADITTYNEGFACSAGSVLFAVGSRRVSPASSVVMVHRAAGGVEGNSDDVRKYAEALDACSTAMAACYAKATGDTPQQWMDKMKAETWMSGEQAVASGLATDTGGEDISMEDDSDMGAESRLIVATFKNIPQNLRSRLTVTAQAPAQLPTPPTNQQPTKIKSMKNIIAALVATGITGLAADADETAVLPHITALIGERNALKTESTAQATARKTRITALVDAAVTEKTIVEAQKAGLITLGSGSPEGETSAMAILADIRALKTAPAARGARPVPRGEGEGDSIESLLEDQKDAIAAGDGEKMAEINAKLAEKRGRKDLFSPVAETRVYSGRN